MKDVISLYREAFKIHGRSSKSLLCPKGRQYERFFALTKTIEGSNFTILDYGCGFGDLKIFLDQKFEDYLYTGVDIVPEFIAECLQLHGKKGTFKVINSHLDVEEKYDYIIISGVFNTLFFETPEQHWNFIQEIIAHLFERARIALFIDFMTDNVDFMQSRSYHQNPSKLYEFVINNLTRRLSIDCSYMPFEFCINLYVDQCIIKPNNTYRNSNNEK